MKNAKITTKTNHDSLWIKIKFADVEGTVRVNRGSITARSKGKTKEAVKSLSPILDRMFKFMTSDEKGTYGERLALLKAELEAQYT